jgi:para-nitrobenzyl esterase
MAEHSKRAAGISRRAALLSLGVGVSLGFAFSGPARTEDAVVETTSGKIRGVRKNGALIFRGIRYGESTDGLRFMLPVVAKPRPGVTDAMNAGSSAPQIPGATYPIAAWYTKIEPVSEDCLFLNLFAPAPAELLRKKPVMVFLHGGTWMNCAGSAPGFEGANLARDGEVVVVTINHRLNLFGHMALDDRDERFADSANVGVHDMVLALEWVRDNIAAFGGDPRNVTIFGQSGGAAKVATLMAFPRARGLFHKAIMQSFSGGAHMRTQDEAARIAHDVAKAAGLERADAETLRTLPMEMLIATMRTMTDAVYPIIDSRNFHSHPYDPVMAAGAADIPLMIGNATTEATWFLGGDMKNFKLGADDARNRIGRYLGVQLTETDRIIDAYRSTMTDPTSSDLLIAIISDYQFRKNTMHFAEMRADRGNAPVFYYLFDWKSPVNGGVFKTHHALEIPFVFGSLDGARASVGNGSDLGSLTETVQSIWTSFARTGSPQTAALPTWPQYDGRTKPAMVIDTTSSLVADPGGVARQAVASLPPYEYSVPLTYVRA